eukprot:TRINITY_DN81530_c0_g1_i1.p1 TRINITY_DN81530_c0_g1~~TRINITY_DN81530_c0_g1_i1.p1  ORF type:complete len:522 (+),score=133.87 TRINITY_DN81530_c0_g1_i1:124-1689(+)
MYDSYGGGLTAKRPFSARGGARSESLRTAELLAAAGSKPLLTGRSHVSHPGANAQLHTGEALLPAAATAAHKWPTWGDANMQFCVNASIQAVVQPRLDAFAERLGGVLASAHEELDVVRTLVDQCEARMDGRLSGLEARLAVLADGSVRAEQRERDLNSRLAGLCEGTLLRKAEEGQAAAAAGGALEASGGVLLQALQARLEEVERRAQEGLSKSGSAEEASRRAALTVRRTEDRLDEIEERSKEAQGRIQEHVRKLFVEVKKLAAEASAQREAPREPGAFEEVALVRLHTLEEQVQKVSASVVAHNTERSWQVAALERRSESYEKDVEALAAEVRRLGADHSQILPSQPPAKSASSAAASSNSEARGGGGQDLVARVDDMNVRLGALKVKADGFEGRLRTLGERVEAARSSSEASRATQQGDLEDRFDRRFAEAAEDTERRLASLAETCEEIVEQALDHRLAIIAGEAPRKRGTVGSSRSPDSPGPGAGLRLGPGLFADLAEGDVGRAAYSRRGSGSSIR